MAILIGISGCPPQQETLPVPEPTPLPTPAPTLTPEPDMEVILRLHAVDHVSQKLLVDLARAFLTSRGIQVNPISEREETLSHVLIQGKHPETSLRQGIEIFIGNSENLWQHVTTGQRDVGLTSREFEREGARRTFSEKMPVAHALAIDGIAVVMHRENPVTTLSHAQLVDIFSGAATDWSEVGGEAGTITLYAPDVNAEMHPGFRQFISDDRPLPDNVVYVETDAGIVVKLSNDKDSIGIVSLTYVKNAVIPDSLRVAAREPLWSHPRSLYFLQDAELSPLIVEFVSFALSPEGQAIVSQHGFLCPGEQQEFDPEQHAPRKLGTLLFRSGQIMPDKKLRQEIEDIFTKLQDEWHEQEDVGIYGFTDNQGDSSYNQRLSKQRADLVAQQFIAQGVDPLRIDSKGFGELYPVAANNTPEGRNRNRRVEIRLLNPDRFSGLNRTVQGATVLELNARDPHGQLSYDQGDRTDWYQTTVAEIGTLTWHIWHRSKHAELWSELYRGPNDSPENVQPFQESPLETCTLVGEDVCVAPLHNAEPGTYYAKVFVRPGTPSVYEISTTFNAGTDMPPILEATPTPTPTPTPRPTPEISPSPTPTPISPSLTETTPPRITIFSPEDQCIIAEDAIVITGKVEDSSEITIFQINGETVPLEAGNEFSYRVANLNVGINTITVNAWDAFLNPARVEIRIIRRQ